jgi:hypothetical protein
MRWAVFPIMEVGSKMTQVVGAKHEFHDAAFVQCWADRFVPSPPRLALFDMILAQIHNIGVEEPNILELGPGPGYMARHILERDSAVRYEALDFSTVFFDVAKMTLGSLNDRVTMTKADLMDQSWPKCLVRPPHAIISTWTLHDLGSERAIGDVYVRCFELLSNGGVLVNGDFIKPDGTALEYEPGRFEISRHLQLLREAGFKDPISLHHFECEIEHPTAAQNYACLAATK